MKNFFFFVKKSDLIQFSLANQWLSLDWNHYLFYKEPRTTFTDNRQKTRNKKQ